MALKRNFQQLDTFSMSSMTDVIFLLLIFFMVTSTIIFPGAIDVNLPESNEQTQTKPHTEVYITADKQMYLVENLDDDIFNDSEPREVDLAALEQSFVRIARTDSVRAVAIYADSLVDYGQVVRVLDLASRMRMHPVLSTRMSGTAPVQSEQQIDVETDVAR